MNVQSLLFFVVVFLVVSSFMPASIVEPFLSPAMLYTSKDVLYANSPGTHSFNIEVTRTGEIVDSLVIKIEGMPNSRMVKVEEIPEKVAYNMNARELSKYCRDKGLLVGIDMDLEYYGYNPSSNKDAWACYGGKDFYPKDVIISTPSEVLYSQQGEFKIFVSKDLSGQINDFCNWGSFDRQCNFPVTIKTSEPARFAISFVVAKSHVVTDAEGNIAKGADIGNIPDNVESSKTNSQLVSDANNVGETKIDSQPVLDVGSKKIEKKRYETLFDVIVAFFRNLLSKVGIYA